LVLALNTADILRYGLKQFYAEAKACGLEAILVLDLPPEEGSDFIFLSRQQQLNMIFSVAENTANERLSVISGVAMPFIRLLVNQKFLISKKEHYFAQLKAVTDALKNISTKSIILETEELPRESLQRVFNHTDGIIYKDRILSGPDFSLRQAEKKIKKIIKEIDKK
jgi:tryptophan synthase alpha chain